MSHSLETFTFASQYTRIVKPGGQTEIEANRILSMFAVYLLSQMCKIYCKHIATSAQKPIYYKIDETLSLSASWFERQAIAKFDEKWIVILLKVSR